MKTRPVAAAFFVICCLLLCGLILRRQIAAHPLPPETAQGGIISRTRSAGFPPSGYAGNFAVRPPRDPDRVAVQGQMKAFHGGDGFKAVSYQSHTMRQTSAARPSSCR